MVGVEGEDGGGEAIGNMELHLCLQFLIKLKLAMAQAYMITGLFKAGKVKMKSCIREHGTESFHQL